MAEWRTPRYVAQYRWAVPMMPMTPRWLDERDKGFVFSALRRLGIIALLEVPREER